jgi:hypothetical protein
MESERKRITHNSGGSINGPSIRGRVGLTLKLDELLGPSMTFEVILIQMKYLHIHNISIHLNFYHNRFINECVRRIFLNSQKDKCHFVNLNDSWVHTVVKYFRIHNISIHKNFYQNRFINECVRRIFLNSRKYKWTFVTFNDLW